MHFFDKLRHKKFKKGQSIPSSTITTTSTTFTMKKSFAALKMSSLAGAFGHCRTDEDKVKLLSVLSNTSFNGDDDEDSASSVSNGDIVLTSSMTSSTDENQHRSCRDADEDERRTPPMDDLCPTIDINDECCVDDVLLSRSVNNENVAEQRSTPTGKTDDVRSKNVYYDKRRETIKRDADDYSNSVKQQNEWTFTLYDFDAKGKVTKEDILSLVRSIYEVLAKTKIPIIRGCQQDTTTGRPIGAFKVKLAVINDDDDVVDDRTKKTSNKKMFDDDDDTLFETTAATTGDDNNNNSFSNFDIDRFYEEIPLIRKKPLKRQHDNGGKQNTSTSPIPYGKLHRHSGIVNFATDADNGAASTGVHHHPAPIGASPPRKHCTNCTYRDYVNLSEVENCCSHHQNNHQASSTSACVHHIRHCDRHCHCPTSTKMSQIFAHTSMTPCNDPCLTSLENEYEKNLHRKLFSATTPSQQCCKTRSSLDTVINLHNHNHHGLPLNERARAYYSQQRASAKQSAASYNKFVRNDVNSATLDYVDVKEMTSSAKDVGPTPKDFGPSEKKFGPSTKDLAPLTKELRPITPSKCDHAVKISSHQKKHRNREKDKIRAMQQVREWILNDVDLPTNSDDESAKKLSNDVLDVEDAVKVNELRGEADGCNRLLIEHNHVHEHHHFHHF